MIFLSFQEAFDVEGFCEMLSAYLPEFVNIDHSRVCEWIFQLSSTLSQKKFKGNEIYIVIPNLLLFSALGHYKAVCTV